MKTKKLGVGDLFSFRLGEKLLYRLFDEVRKNKLYEIKPSFSRKKKEIILKIKEVKLDGTKN